MEDIDVEICIQKENILELKQQHHEFSTTISTIEKFVVELRIYNKYQKERIEQHDKLIEKLTTHNLDADKKSLKIQILIEQHDKDIKKNIEDINELQQERNFNFVKFLKTNVSYVVIAGITALICWVMFSFLKILPEIEKVKEVIP